MKQDNISSKTVTKIFFVLLLGATTAFSQEQGETENILHKGNISGKVIDKNSKQLLPYVNVQILGTQAGAATDSEEKYFLKSIEEEVYKLKFTAVGYTSHIETDVRVVRNKTTIVKDIELVASVDILNLYGRLNVNEERFIETTGKIDEKGFEMIPTFGVKLEF